MEPNEGATRRSERGSAADIAEWATAEVDRADWEDVLSFQGQAVGGDKLPRGTEVQTGGQVEALQSRFRKKDIRGAFAEDTGVGPDGF